MAAKIGQSLLKKNRTLTEQNYYLEERVAHIAEEVCAHQHVQKQTHKMTDSDYLQGLFYNFCSQIQKLFFIAITLLPQWLEFEPQSSTSITADQLSPTDKEHDMWLKTLVRKRKASGLVD